jgi:choline dehydrogenase-like flavoprotein
MNWDVCIVGSGAGGAPIAYELSRAGYRVIVLEKGPRYTEEAFTKDEIAVSRRDCYTPRLWEELHVINQRDENGNISRYVGSESGWSFWNGSMVGGSSNLMSGFFHRMKPADFRLKSEYGSIKGANVVDWPIGYAELEPYYEKVERVVGVSGKALSHPCAEPRSTADFPFPPTETSPVSGWFDAACKKLGYHSIPTPRAVLSHDALGRKGCSYSNFCGSYGCATGAKGSARAALLDRCDATVITGAFVYRLESDGKRVVGAHYYDQNNSSHAVHARIFVIAAQAIETARLLLNSKNRFFPNGLANNAGQVGKNLIFSAGGVGQGRFVFEKLTPVQQKNLMIPGLFFNRSLQEWYEYKDSGAVHKGGTIDFLFEHANIISRAVREFYDDDGNLLWGRPLFEKIQKQLTTTRVLKFEVFSDWLPTDHCNITLDSEVKDRYGIFVAAINLYAHPHDLEVGEYLSKKAVGVLEAMGAEEVAFRVTPDPPPNLVAGGCRFGTDPAQSVLDPDCKAHELENLYVSDASFMPTGGSVPYTWTIYANAFRVADRLAEHLKKSGKNPILSL